MSTYQKNKIVKLISGGPNMVMDIQIKELKYPLRGVYRETKGYGDEYVRCTWFDGSEKREGFFDLNMLEDVIKED